MKIPKYWGQGAAESMDRQGKTVSYSCWRWSDVNEDDARAQARKKAGEILAKLQSGEQLNAYSYSERPLREEIVQTITAPGKKELALVTRNSYGALVLNAAGAMFMDIDFKAEGLGAWLSGLFGKLFGKRAATQEETQLAAVRRWADARPELGLRVYRTFGGLRCLITNQVFDPAHPNTEAMMKELNCDPLYVRLCRQQECFRARLTPKPWRIRAGKPPVRFPFASSADEQTYRRWESDYNRISAAFAVCRKAAELGRREIHPEIEPIIALHDRFCCPGAAALA